MAFKICQSVEGRAENIFMERKAHLKIVKV